MDDRFSLKAFFQNAINNGDIKSYNELLAMVNAESLEITRNGWTNDRMRYMGLRPPNGRRFRIYFAFHRSAETPLDGAQPVEQD
ncbi:hypothetical protein [Paraburkholderia tagetis]|uniref:Uncharacterized protein n=1 Tax=Paraburkholderia tagetis TaxID=2913261 RepID=A0A9X1RXQ5_9BURK|nr:hypothetical protein [Paraburkholderia tagetis]MCG5077224.1 hypothetical protein [Paraburkholderia tagetis]